MKEKYRMSMVKHRGTWSDRIARESSQYLILVEELIDINKMTGLKYTDERSPQRILKLKAVIYRIYLLLPNIKVPRVWVIIKLNLKG
jgi:hypothetical protein